MSKIIGSLLPSGFDIILKIINDATQACKGIIPDDRWKESYTPAGEPKEEIQAGARFSGRAEGGHLLGVTGIQAIKDTTVIRHAYVLPRRQGRGIGTGLLEHLLGLVDASEILAGTWAHSTGALRFYEKHGFKLMSSIEKDRLLRTYWNILGDRLKRQVC